MLDKNLLDGQHLLQGGGGLGPLGWLHLSVPPLPASSVYRLQFHETFAEMNHRSNEWKTVIGCVFFFCGFTALLIWWQRVYGELQHLT